MSDNDVLVEGARLPGVRIPPLPVGGVKREHECAVDQFWLHFPEVRYKAACLRHVDWAEPRWTAVVMPVDMKHRGTSVVGILQSGTNSVGIHHRADHEIPFIVVVGHRQIGLREDNNPVIGEPRQPACDKADSLRGMFVRARQVRMNLQKEVAPHLED